MKYLIALIPFIGASVLLWGQPYSGTGTTVLVTNYPIQYNSNFYRLSNFNPMVFYYTNHQVFIADSRYGPTNIVISNDYSGTIQIGTNFATTKELDTWMQVLGSMKRFEEAWTTTNANRLATYTVNVADGHWTHTNVIEIHKCSNFCTRMRYVENGVTNDFHAAFASFTVKTNSP